MSDEALPAREIRDANVLRALAHPARLRLIEELALAGPMTATDLAVRVGESAANCSWHLRQLARYGFVEEAGGGAGRRRPWQVVTRGNRWEHSPDDADLAAAGHAAASVVLSGELAALETWRAAVAADPPQWRDAAFFSQSMGWLTADELSQVNREIAGIMMRYLDRINDRGKRPDGARPIRFVAWGVPAIAQEPPAAKNEPPPTSAVTKPANP